MDFVVRKTIAPEFGKEILEDADSIARGLDYEDDVGIVKYVDGRKIGVYFIPFSLYLALKRNGMPTRHFGVMGLVQKGERYLMTIQAKRTVEPRGIGRVLDIPERKSISFQGFASEWEENPIESVYAELEEELGLENGDVTEAKREFIMKDDEILLAVLFRTELEEGVMQRLRSLAVDSWEAKEVMLMTKADAREFLKDSPLLAVFDRLVS